MTNAKHISSPPRTTRRSAAAATTAAGNEEDTTTATAAAPTEEGEEGTKTIVDDAELNGPDEKEDVSGNKRKADDTAETTTTTTDATASKVDPAKKKRLCRYPGCIRVIKSQGHCQKHGARAKRCKVEGCEKQAQGTHDGMCKKHWKAANFPEEATKGGPPPEPEGESVYDSILPMSIAYRPMQQKQSGTPAAATPAVTEEAATSSSLAATAAATAANINSSSSSSSASKDLLDPPTAPEGFQVMPLVSHLKEGTLAGKPAGWHRNAERRARGLFPVTGLSVQLEPWERQMALMEILLLSGGTPYANFRELAHAWGREKGFHHVLANSVCERRGEVERKQRSDCGKTMSKQEKEAFKKKLQEARDRNGTSKKVKEGGGGGGDNNTNNAKEEESGENKGEEPNLEAAAVAAPEEGEETKVGDGVGEKQENTAKVGGEDIVLI